MALSGRAAWHKSAQDGSGCLPSCAHGAIRWIAEKALAAPPHNSCRLDAGTAVVELPQTPQDNHHMGLSFA